MSTGHARFPVAALLKGGLLRTQCTEPVRWTCPECGGPCPTQGQACMTCFAASVPVAKCDTCLQRLGTVAPGSRPCLSSQAYEAEPNRAPIFSRPDQVLWGLKVTPTSALEVLAEADLRDRLASGNLSDAVLVSSDFGHSFRAARDTPVFSDVTRHGPAPSRFAVEQAWAAIERVPHPPELRIPDIGNLGVTPCPLPAGTDRQAERSRRAEVCRAAQHAYDAMLGQVSQLQRASRFTATRTKLKALRDEYRQLPTREQDAVAEVLDRERIRQRTEFLATCRLDTAEIPGVGDKKKAALHARGIRTAADATSSRVDAIRGFGPELTASVLAWRRGCESQHAFNSKLADAAREAVQRQCLTRKRELEAALTSGPNELEGVAAVQQQLGLSLQSAALALAQAQADLAAVSEDPYRVLAIAKKLIGWCLKTFVAVYLAVYGAIAISRLLWPAAQEKPAQAVAAANATRKPAAPNVSARTAPPASPAVPTVNAAAAPPDRSPEPVLTEGVVAATPNTAELHESKGAVEARPPSFDCAKASTGVERVICGSPRLSAMDVELASLYFAIRDNAAPAFAALREQTVQTQTEWLFSRDACGQLARLWSPPLEALNADLVVDCLEKEYSDRLAQLREAADFRPPAPVRVGGRIKAPRKTRDVRPVYPPIAQSARVQGVVIIEATVGEDGSIKNTTLLRSIPLLDQAALDAVSQWRFAPTLLNGVPVAVIMTISVEFALQ